MCLVNHSTKLLRQPCVAQPLQLARAPRAAALGHVPPLLPDDVQGARQPLPCRSASFTLVWSTGRVGGALPT